MDRRFFVILGGGLLACCQPLPNRPETIRQLLTADIDFAAATAQRGLEGWVGAFAEDGVQLPSAGPPVVGHQGIRNQMARVFADKQLALTWQPEAAEASEALGYTRGTWKLTRTKDGVTTVVSKGKYLTIWKRRHGRWRVAVDIGNDEPAPGG